jgi:acyl dehydratase
VGRTKEPGRLRTVSLERINFFSGGYPKGPNWPAKNIHTDLETAKKCGLETVAASGAMFEGYLVDLMIDLFGVEWLNYGMMTLAFINVVNKDDTSVRNKGRDGNRKRLLEVSDLPM